MDRAKVFILPTPISKLTDDSPEMLAAACRLAERGFRALPALIDLIPREPVAAALALGLIGTAAADAAAALRPFLSFQGSDLRVVARSSMIATALGQIGGPATQILIDALRDPNPAVRANAARGLGGEAMSGSDVIAALVAALHDPSWDVVNNAAVSLGEHGGAARAAIPTLQALLDHEWEQSLIASASRAAPGQFVVGAIREAAADVRLSVADALFAIRGGDPNRGQ